jgi:hypothetical protein
MNYEDLHVEYTQNAEKLKAHLTAAQKFFKRIDKNLQIGDLQSAARDLASLEVTANTITSVVEDVSHVVRDFDDIAYLSSGDFAAQLVKQCEQRQIDIVGENNSWEIFPYRVKIEASDRSVLVNGKKAAGIRPSALAATLEQGKTRLLSTSFNATQFANELAVAYDLALVAGAKKGKEPVVDADVYLSTLYKYLTPMRRFRKDYDARAYAFDLARLYDTENVTVADGRRIQFGPSRNNNRAVRILDRFENELFIATIRFYHS